MAAKATPLKMRGEQVKGKSQAMIEHILKMRQENHSIKKITLALGVSRNTVRRYLRKDSKNDNEYSPVDTKTDWSYAAGQYQLGRPLKRIYEELEPGLSYSQFTRTIKLFVKKEVNVAIKLQHEPGEKVQVDYADGLFITNPKTGVKTKTQFFCGVLPASSMTFGEFTMTQKSRDFIRSHERMWHYFGGVTKYVVLDNLKAGVTKAHRYDPDLNKLYCDYANHTGFAALPARVKTPRDKASVEAAIGVIQRDFFDRYRNHSFYTLQEMNWEFTRYLDEFNRRLMADYGCSRLERFELEKEKLKPLPENVYEFFEWKTSKVHPDSCIELERSVYSVPYKYVHQYVHVKYSDKLVMILDQQTSETVAVHARSPKFSHSILDEHLPPMKTQMKSFNVLSVLKFADNIGERTRAYVDWQFSLEEPLRALRRLQGLMRFYQKHSPTKEAMEHGAVMAFTFKQRRLSYLEACVKNYSPLGSHLHLVSPPKRELKHIHLRTQIKD